MISISFDPKSKKIIDGMMRTYATRVARGEALLVHELATVLYREVVGANAKVMGKRRKPQSYAKKLKVALVEGSPADAMAAVYLERDHDELKVEDLMRLALIIKPTAQASAWVQEIAAMGPFPADLLPAPIPRREATVIARSVRPDEAQRLRDHLLDNRAELSTRLRKAQAPNSALTSGTKGIGTRVYIDIAWEVLRAEFGFDGRKQDAHWRPAITAMVDHIPKAMDHFAQYLVDGDEAVFDTIKDGDIRWKAVQNGVRFQRELLPFIKRTVK